MLKNRIWIRSAVALFALTISNSFVDAQDAQSQTPALKTYRMKHLLGTIVHIEGNESIGTVDDVVFDDNGTIDYLIVLNQGKLVSVPWDAAKFNFEKRVATINIAPARFRQIPTFTVEEYPVFSAPAYRTQTYHYYGLTPGQTRRLNRSL